MKSKVCFKCKQEKPLSGFYKHPEMGDGHLNKCKECTKKDVSKNYYSNIEYYKKYEKERFNRPSRKKQQRKYQQERRKKHPKKYKAHYLTSNAIRDGRLIPQPCEVCGTTNNVQAHHDDYNKPLNVRWLCFSHHRQEHGQMQYVV